MFRFALLGLLAALHVGLSPLDAQDVSLGSEVRARLAGPDGQPPAPWMTGAYRSLAGDTLWILNRGTPQPLPVDAWEIQVKSGTYGGEGLLIGALSGIALGGALGLITHEPRYSYGDLGRAVGCAWAGDCPPPPQVNSRAGDAMGAAVGMGLAGSLVGWLVGRSITEWTSYAPEIDVGPGSVSMTVRF